MKKIMFSDQYKLTKAVLTGCKTMTRRIVNDENHSRSPFKIGDVVAIAQSYCTLIGSGFVAPKRLDYTCEDSAGFINKMFVRADLMPHRIRITDMRFERLQDISDEECIKEGVVPNIGHTFIVPGIMENHGRNIKVFDSPREAFAALIDRISGKGTWQRNPWVFAYSFKLYYVS